MKAVKTTLGILTLALISAVSADPIQPDTVYTLSNHPDGNAAPPSYGLRLDGLTDGRSRNIHTFEFDHNYSDNYGMYMYWDSDYDALYIYGMVYGGSNNRRGGYRDAGYYNVSFAYTGVYDCFNDGLCSNYGYGYMWDRYDAWYLTSVSGRNSYDFQLNSGHRGFDGVSGWGWLNHCPYYSWTDGGSCYRHLYSSDWLFTVNEVAEPETIGLLALGLLGIGVVRRRRRVATIAV